MRPEIVAFRELDNLVRNLTDQLAGYRRRALSAESRVRELELQVAAVEHSLTEARRETATVAEAREHALAAARESTATAKAAREALARLEQAAAKSANTSVEVFPTPSAGGAGADDGPLAAENERLKARLADAKERTSKLADRVRFLRQQLMAGADR